MSTASLRRDHELIEKVIKAMESTIQLLVDGNQIPESILMPVIDFTKNFTDVCHHSKEEKSLFPALEQAGMPSNMGPIAMMLIDHQRSREIGTEMEESAKKYLASGDSSKLISDMQQYVEHITEHLWKENNRLFSSRGGGIGRRAGFRILWGDPWGFESPLSHQKDDRMFAQ